MGAKTIPVLPSRDFDETARFYQPLGFSETGRWPNEYLILQRSSDGVELHFFFSPGIDPKTNDFSCYVRFDDSSEARALHEEWKAADVSTGGLHAPVETDYGLLEFALIDPDANLIRLGGVIRSNGVESTEPG